LGNDCATADLCRDRTLSLVNQRFNRSVRTHWEPEGTLGAAFCALIVPLCLAQQDEFPEAWSTRPVSGTGYGVATAFECHYKPEEISENWGLSVKVIREIFSAEPGVLKVDRPETRNKRGYCSMRIPESVVVRVHKKLTGGSR
jgi:hypothetical protein